MIADDLERLGFAVSPRLLSADEIHSLRGALGDLPHPGRRGVLELPAVAQLATSATLLALVAPHLPDVPFPVRAICFNKSAESNWLVAWHQDLTIAVRERRDAAGFGPWSVKHGVPHVQPPVEVLQRMLTVRLHLDDADESNGALRVVPGSHRRGRLNAMQIEDLRQALPIVTCRASAGEALLMRPLLLHASSRSASPRRRRVLHIEYAADSLPGGLDWYASR